jgi:hypothetical protein
MSDTEITNPAFAVPPIPPSEDGDEPDFQPRPRKRARALTLVLAALVIAGAGFVGGVLVQKHHGTSNSSSSLAGLASRFGRGSGGSGGSGGAGGGRGAGGFGGAEVGQVKLVDGPNVYVTDTSGNVVKVVTNGASQLSKTDATTVKNIAPGDTVIVRGTQNADGSYTATSLTDGGTSASGLGGFGGFGGSGTDSATGTSGG